MSKLLITGGAGFIRSNLTEHFLGKGFQLNHFTTKNRCKLVR